MRQYILEYLFNGEPRTHIFEFKQPQLPVHEAAIHLLQLHFGDGENSLIMATADATPEEILEQSELVGLTQIMRRRSTRLMPGAATRVDYQRARSAREPTSISGDLIIN